MNAFEDRELDAILQRLDRLTESVDRISRRLESLAFAALGSRGPQVRRRDS